MKINVSQFAVSCECGKEHKIDVQEIVIESGAVKRLEELMNVGMLKDYRFPVILCDTNTYSATRDLLKEIYLRSQIVKLNEKNLHADNHNVDLVLKAMADDSDLILAVGSGTIHDLSRYVAYERKIPFVSVPTAASVDGFVSTVAAMTWDGMKKTIPAAAPVCVIADTDIFAKAPYRLTASGISDLFGKYIALADWKIAHLVTGEYLCERVYRLEMEALEEVKDSLNGLRTGSSEAYNKLMYALLLSGLAMQMVGSSRPASCAEHHVSHLWEMEIVNDYVDAFHGEKVSIGLMLCLDKYKSFSRAIRKNKCTVHSYNGFEMELLRDTFGRKGILEGILEENTPDPMEKVRSERVKEVLSQIGLLLEELPDSEEMEELLTRGGCKKFVEDIGLSHDMIPITMQLSPYVRNRLSFNRLSKMLEIDED